MSASPMLVRDTIERDLADEPQSVVKVHEAATLAADIREYVLTDRLAEEFAEVLEAVIETARPPGKETDKVGIWVSGFFGSGKSHFAKLVGHLLADTPVGSESARGQFARLLHEGRDADQRVAGLLQQARTYRLGCQLVAFDITALHSAAAEHNVGLTFLTALYQALGLSSVISFAERELELQGAGRYQRFLELYQQKAARAWADDKNFTMSSAIFAECLAELLPSRYASAELAHGSLELSLAEEGQQLTIVGVVDRMLRWLDARQKQAGKDPQRLLFVADEVGAWAGRDLKRIDQIRSLVETLGTRGQGRVWLLATSQEKLSAVLQNAPMGSEREARDLQQRLEARFGTNVHLESSEVGTVIEERILRKRPTSYPELKGLWCSHEQQLRDIAQPPGLEMGGSYPAADLEPFIADYPFLPYQLEAAADIFGGMRGVKVSSGARSMIKVAFDATRALADQPLGKVVSWDRIFNAANSDNEFADEQYLGSQGLTYIANADRDLPDAPFSQPSRLLKALWLAQQSGRIPRTPRNLARLLVDDLDTDVLELEQHISKTLVDLERYSYVRAGVGTEGWKFLTQDEVTVEKIVRRIAEDEIKQQDIRKATSEIHQRRLLALCTGRLTVGKSNTTFDYGVYLDEVPLKYDQAPVKLRAVLGTSQEDFKRVAEDNAVYLDQPDVRWTVLVASKLGERLRRALAIDRLPTDEEFRRVATTRTREEAERLQGEAAELRRAAEGDVERAFQGGTLYWGGERELLEGTGNGGKGAASVKARVEEALRDRVRVAYPRFDDGDRPFSPASIDKLFGAAPGDREALDPALGLFAGDGHLNGSHVLVEELSQFLKSSTKTAGQDASEHFARPPFGWQPDLVRYVAAAMFVDGKLSVVDPGGKRYEDPKAGAARAQFGTAAFRKTRLDIEEEALTPAEYSQARTLLTDLGQAPADGGEIALKEATLQLVADLGRRLSVLDQARQAALPLPTSYDGMQTTLDTLSQPATRAKVVRALLARAEELRQAVADVVRLEQFEKAAGFAQYRRSQRLLQAALQAGLAEDPRLGAKVTEASEQIEALKTQRRVLDDWEGAYKQYRLQALEAFRSAYLPLRTELHQRSTAAQDAVTGMPEYKALSFSDALQVRYEFLGEGKPLHQVELPALNGEDELLAANAQFSIAHMRAALAALDGQLSQARARVLQLYAKEQEEKGAETKVIAWKPAEAFAGRQFKTPRQVDEAFDAEKERLKALLDGKTTIQVCELGRGVYLGSRRPGPQGPGAHGARPAPGTRGGLRAPASLAGCHPQGRRAGPRRARTGGPRRARPRGGRRGVAPAGRGG